MIYEQSNFSRRADYGERALRVFLFDFDEPAVFVMGRRFGNFPSGRQRLGGRLLALRRLIREQRRVSIFNRRNRLFDSSARRNFYLANPGDVSVNAVRVAGVGAVSFGQAKNRGGEFHAYIRRDILP